MAGSPAHASGFACGGVPVGSDADRSIRASIKNTRNPQSVNARSPCTNKNARATEPLALRELLISRQSPWCLADHAIFNSAVLTGVIRVYTIYSREINDIALVRVWFLSSFASAILLFQDSNDVIRWCPHVRRSS